MKDTDVRLRSASLFYLPITFRMPLKFGAEIATTITCARVRVRVEDRRGKSAEGWGETPLSVTWIWPSALSYEARLAAVKGLCERLVPAWAAFPEWGHPLEIGHRFLHDALPELTRATNATSGLSEPLPHLAALVCCSAFDIALHDAYGNLHGVPVYRTYSATYMNQDLAGYLEPAPGVRVSFRGKYPADFFVSPQTSLAAWHLVGGKDPVDETELTGSEPRDGHPVLLRDWIRQDGLTCLKVKLRGNDAAWDYERLVKIGTMAMEESVDWLTADLNCTVTDPGYVNDILDRLVTEHPRIHGMVLYVEQPFPYDLEANPIDVHSVSARKPLFMDESAHDWKLIRLGRELGWTGVALKTCKTQTGALLSLCWAKAHGMTLMVQDLTNPMIAQVPHVLLAAHAGTIMGVETNAMQFYPDASLPESRVHPGLYRRRDGRLDLGSVRGPGFGYRIGEIERRLPAAAAEA